MQHGAPPKALSHYVPILLADREPVGSHVNYLKRGLWGSLCVGSCEFSQSDQRASVPVDEKKGKKKERWPEREESNTQLHQDLIVITLGNPFEDAGVPSLGRWLHN